jgi:hypothetical protein
MSYFLKKQSSPLTVEQWTAPPFFKSLNQALIFSRGKLRSLGRSQEHKRLISR